MFLKWHPGICHAGGDGSGDGSNDEEAERVIRRTGWKEIFLDAYTYFDMVGQARGSSFLQFPIGVVVGENGGLVVSFLA